MERWICHWVHLFLFFFPLLFSLRLTLWHINYAVEILLTASFSTASGPASPTSTGIWRTGLSTTSSTLRASSPVPHHCCRRQPGAAPEARERRGRRREGRGLGERRGGDGSGGVGGGLASARAAPARWRGGLPRERPLLPGGVVAGLASAHAPLLPSVVGIGAVLGIWEIGSGKNTGSK